jgi:hypothetical protein
VKSKSYALRLLIAFDQFLNVLLLNGSEDHTISGRVGYKALMTNKKHWRLAEKIINTIFWFDKDHCYTSIEWDEIK